MALGDPALEVTQHHFTLPQGSKQPRSMLNSGKGTRLFLHTGVLDLELPFHSTLSPSLHDSFVVWA